MVDDDDDDVLLFPSLQLVSICNQIVMTLGEEITATGSHYRE